MDQPVNPYQELTMEDVATFQRCRKESFWRGSVPMVIGGTLLVGLANARGFFTKRPGFLLPTYFVVGVGGFLAGKISYIGRCKSMFLELHDSRVKDFILGKQQSMPLPTRPSLTEIGGWNRADDAPIDVETVGTYAQRRDYYREQQKLQQQQSVGCPKRLQRHTELHVDRSGNQPSIPLEPDQQHKDEASTRTDYFDSHRPISSYFSDDDYRPKE